MSTFAKELSAHRALDSQSAVHFARVLATALSKEMSDLVIKRVWIEPAECTGHTLCVPEAPGLIEYDKKADVSVVQEAKLHRTQEELKRLLEASEVCPMLAFFIQTSDGSTFNARNELIRSAIRKGDFKWA